MRKYKPLIFIVLISYILLFTGCYSYKDINRVIFVTSLLIDLDDNENIVIYADTLKPYRDTSESSEKGQRSVYKGEGKSLLEAIDNMNLSSSFQLNFSQNKAVIFTQKAAEKGIDTYMDYLNRDQELNVRSYLFVYYGDIEKLMNIASNNEEYLGSFLNDIVNKVSSSPKAIFLNMNDYLTQKKLGSGITIITALEVEKEKAEEKIHLVGGGVIREGKLVDKLEASQTQSYNLLTKGIKNGTIEVANPEDKEKLITLKIIKGKAKTELSLSGGKPQLIKKIKLRTIIGDAQGSLTLSEDNIAAIKSSAQEVLRNRTESFFYEYKGKEIDILNVEREIEIKYPQSINSISPYRAELWIYPEVIIEGSSNIKNTN